MPDPKAVSKPVIPVLKKQGKKEQEPEFVEKKDKRGPWFEGLSETQVPEEKSGFPMVLLLMIVILVCLLALLVFLFLSRHI